MAESNGTRDAAGSNRRGLILATVKENVSLTAIDTETGERVATVIVGTPEVAKPHEIAVSADGRRAFVSLYGTADYGPRNVPANRVAVVDLEKMSLVTHLDLDLYRGPHGMVTDGDGKIWVTVDPNHCALVIDPERLEIERTIWLQAPGHFVARSPDGTRLYFSHKEYPLITEVDVAKREVAARITLPVGAQGLSVDVDGSRLYVGDFHRPLLHVVDCGERRLVDTVPLTGVPGWPYPTPDGRHVVVTTYDEPADRGYVEILERNDLRRRRVVEVPAEPFHSLAERGGDRVLVALANGDIPRVDLAAGTLADGGFRAGGTMPEALVHWSGTASDVLATAPGSFTGS